MYICICKGITEEQLRSASHQGGTDRDILNRLGIGSDCGVCLLSALNTMKPERPAAKNDQKSTKK